MGEPVEPVSPPRVRLWATISGLLVFGLTVPLWGTLGKLQTACARLGVRALPMSGALDPLALLLWAPAFAVWLLALGRAKSGDPKGGTAWFFRLSVVIVLVQLAMFAALLYPLTRPTGR